MVVVGSQWVRRSVVVKFVVVMVLGEWLRNGGCGNGDGNKEVMGTWRVVDLGLMRNVI